MTVLQPAQSPVVTASERSFEVGKAIERTDQPHVVVLGAGPAGLGAAYQLTRHRAVRVSVLERNSWVGGNAASFQLAGMPVDYGSHRLHPRCDPAVLQDIQALLGDDLLQRPRRGRIRLRGRWIGFPLKPLDLAFGLPPAFTLGTAADAIAKIWRRNVPNLHEETFATVLEAGLGKTICRDFYFPYARKIWGLEPEELSGIQAHRRVSAGSLGKMFRLVCSAVPGFKQPGSGQYFHPRYGYGQIAEAYSRAADDGGAQIHLDARVLSVEVGGGGATTVCYEQDGQVQSLAADHVWSTIPVTALARCLKPCPPPDVLSAAESIEFRGMILIYLVLEQERFSEYDAYYFPELDIPISRLSEPKNFTDGQGSPDLTVLCAELPCSVDGPEWNTTNQDLGQMLCEVLIAAGMPVRAAVKEVTTRRIRQAYPIYRHGYERHFDRLDHWLRQFDGILTFGRQGLFSHDNLHHALYMGYSAAACVDDYGYFDRQRWEGFRRIFETHVVED